MRLRWTLPPLAALTLAGVAWVLLRGREHSPEELLAAARTALDQKRPDQPAAQRALDQALELAPAGTDVRAEILLERARLYAGQELPELALGDLRERLEESGPEADTLALACDESLRLEEAGAALQFAERLAALDPARGKSRIGGCRIALADSALATIDRLARTALPLSTAGTARATAQRAAVYGEDAERSSAALEEVLALFTRPDQRRQVAEWIKEAAEHMRIARAAFVESLEPGSTTAAVAGLQDLFLRGGAEREAADLGWVALALPGFADAMPVLARTASALTDLGRLPAARALVLDQRAHGRQSLRPDLLPSHELRDELLEWCLLLERLQLWEELRAAAFRMAGSTADEGRRQLGLFLAASADLHLGRFAPAQATLDDLGTNPLPLHDLPARAWFARAQIARQTGQRSLERYALITGTKAAPLDPPPPLRDELARAWQRLYEIQKADNDMGQAEISLTHALRCAPERAAVLQPLWEEVGRKALATRGRRSPYLLYARARSQDDRGQAVPALSDARELLKSYPGLGPALEIVSHAANKLRDYPQMIAASLELLERGWPGAGASARLRTVPKEYFLPQDRVRWFLLDPRGSLADVVHTLRAQGDVIGAALAARGGPAKFQPPELLPELAEVELEAGLPAVALDTLALLPAASAPFRSAAALALQCALWKSVQTRQPRFLAEAVAKVLASGVAEDAHLVGALDLLLATGHVGESEALLAWLAPQPIPFLDETLLRQAARRLIARAGPAVDDDLERAAALLDDGRPELGRILFALELGDLEAVAREARAALATPLAQGPGRAAVLTLLAGEPARAAELLAAGELDGREVLPELCATALALQDPPLAAEDLPAGRAGMPLSPQLLERVPPVRLLVLALAAEVPPWSTWMLARTAELEPALRGAPWIKLLRSEAWLALDEPTLAQSEFATQGPAQMPLVWWQRARVALASGAPRAEVLEAELGWLEAGAGAGASGTWLALLQAEGALQADERERAVQLLEEALASTPGEPDLLARLAELEGVDGRRTRAIDLYAALFAAVPADRAAPHVEPYLELLRTAREAGEISDSRWWTEVEALEAERPLDPAPPRELAARSFEDPSASDELRRVHALERLERFRQRTPGRSLEALRAGEGERWAELLARYVPERALELTQEELLHDPSDPALWRAAARAELAAGRWQPALARLEALQRVAPERETGRLLALTGYRIENDGARFRQRLEGIERIDEEAEDDPLLRFYFGLSSAGARGKDKLEAMQRTQELWAARTTNGLENAENGRALAIGLFLAGKQAPALAVLAETFGLAGDALERDLITALAYLMRSAEGEPRRIQPVALPVAPEPAASDDGAAEKSPKGARRPAAAKPGDKKQAPRKKPAAAGKKR